MKKESAFKMKGFSGFGNSPVKNDKKYQKDMEALVNSEEGEALDKEFSKKRTDKFTPSDTGPDRPGSKGMYPTGFETKIPRINKLKKV